MHRLEGRSVGFSVAILAGWLVAHGCITTAEPPPTEGYGEPYAGTGKPIYVSDSRGDWDILQGGVEISSEQALEASGDKEYERRRQIARAHNQTLYDELRRNRIRGGLMMAASVAMIAGVFLLGYHRRRRTAKRTRKGWFDWRLALALCASAVLGGYGCYGANKQPSYHVWHTPRPLDRPAYVRQATELYNISVGAPPIDEQPGAVSSIPQAVPGQRMAEDPGTVQ